MCSWAWAKRCSYSLRILCTGLWVSIRDARWSITSPDLRARNVPPLFPRRRPPSLAFLQFVNQRTCVLQRQLLGPSQAEAIAQQRRQINLIARSDGLDGADLRLSGRARSSRWRLGALTVAVGR